ncbi:helix-turn-helix domain-containing protein [Streptomyces sp. NPDC012389]
MSRAAARTGRAAGTREAIMSAAERLFAEQGLSAVSNRQIAEAAGQGNVTAVSYHFGSRTELVRAIMTKHGEQVELIRGQHVSAASAGGNGADVRVWVSCLVRPVTEHLASLGSPSWQARFAVQVMTDPLMRALVTDEALTRPHLLQTLDGLGRCLDDGLPSPVRAERGTMARHLITHTCAERERAQADGLVPSSATSWQETADALCDAITGLLTAPVTSLRPESSPTPKSSPHPRKQDPA